MCYYGSSSTREPVPATVENKIKYSYGGPTQGATGISDKTQLNSDIQRRQRALRLSNNNSGGGVMV